MTILITGAAGFIGYHLAEALLTRGERVVGIDNFDPYYSVALKRARAAELARHSGFSLHELDLSLPASVDTVASLCSDATVIVHLAAQPGVRGGENEPFRYISANLAAQLTILEIALRLKALRHVVYASSSAVYGASPNLPYSLDDRADHPISLYGATKRGGEMMAVAYAAQFGLALTGLRFFTVYGTWGRPDMATWQFTDAIVNGTKLTLFDNGKLSRSFTYVDDIIVGIVAALDLPPALGSTGAGGHKLYNLGNDKSDSVLRYVQVLEQAIGKKAVISLEPRHPADMTDTVSDNSVTERELGWHPRVTIDQGLPKFVEWYRGYTAGKK